MMGNTKGKPAVLFVCLGNICRSPTAEAVFRAKAHQRGLTLEIDSAGTAGYHTGSPPDKRSKAAGESRGYSFKGLKCRRVDRLDFEKFDYVLAMDNENLADLLRICPQEYQHRVQLMLSYGESEFDEVPDPYYGGQKGFELVLDLIEQASDALLDKIEKETF